MAKPTLSITPATPTITPPRGRMMTAAQIAAEKFHGIVSAKWVRATVPGKLRFSYNVVLWYEADVDAYIERTRKDGKAA